MSIYEKTAIKSLVVCILFTVGDSWIHPFYVEQRLENITANQRHFLMNELIPEAILVWQSVLSPIGKVDDPFRLPRHCSQHFVDENACETVCKTVTATQECAGFAIPAQHMSERIVCKHVVGSLADCTIARGGEGVANTAFLLYIGADGANCTSAGDVAPAVARAEICSLDDATDRPLAAYINFCPSSLASHRRESYDTTDAKRWQEQRAMAIHEIGHALGFASWLTTSWRQRNSLPRTPRDACGNPPIVTVDGSRLFPKSKSQFIEEARKVALPGVTAISTDTVLRVLRRTFDCNLLTNAPLVNNPSGSHWKEGLLNTEIMAGTSSLHGHGQHLSNLTLAFFYDSGWYDVNFTSPVVEAPSWGWKSGCEFALSACAGGTKMASAIGPFCDTLGDESCSPNHLALATCVEGRAHFGDGDASSPSCKFYHADIDEDCRIPATRFPVGYVDMRGTTNSRCIITEPVLLAPGHSTMQSRKAMCLNTECDIAMKSIRIYTRDGLFVTCTSAGHRMTYPDHPGGIICPSYETICSKSIRVEHDALNGNITMITDPRQSDSTGSAMKIPLLAALVGLGGLAVCLFGWQCKKMCKHNRHDSQEENDEAPHDQMPRPKRKKRKKKHEELTPRETDDESEQV